MHKKQWNGVLNTASLVHEMNIDRRETVSSYARHKLRERLIDAGFSLFPIEMVPPIFGQ
jgi:hypothetical protein